MQPENGQAGMPFLRQSHFQAALLPKQKTVSQKDTVLFISKT